MSRPHDSLVGFLVDYTVPRLFLSAVYGAAVSMTVFALIDCLFWSGVGNPIKTSQVLDLTSRTSMLWIWPVFSLLFFIEFTFYRPRSRVLTHRGWVEGYSMQRTADPDKAEDI